MTAIKAVVGHGRRRFITLSLGALAFIALAVLPAWGVDFGGFNIDGNIPDEGATLFPDPFGNDKELGPVNGNDTKLGVIHDAATPMLDFTNPNAQVDLRNIWLDTNEVNGDDFLYFAWERDSNKGSGIIIFEFQSGALSSACDFDAGDIDQVLPETAAETALIEGCNPWSGRQDGDFLLVWDQQGQEVIIWKRTFTEVNGSLVLGPNENLGTNAKAELSVDGFRGEAAVNLSQTVFTDPNQCFAIANVIPGTVTGNSDTADYKDTVLFGLPDELQISSGCDIEIKKQTVGGYEQFSFVEDITSTGAFDLTTSNGNNPVDKDFTGLSNGTYVVTEDGETGWDLTGISCSTSGAATYKIGYIDSGSFTTGAADATKDGFDTGDDSVSITVAAGSPVTCTFTNSKRPQVKVVKALVPSSDGGLFDLKIGSTTYVTDGSDGADTGFKYVSPGSVTVSEAAGTGTDLTAYDSKVACDSSKGSNDPGTSHTFTVAYGDQVTCTITNTAQFKVIVLVCKADGTLAQSAVEVGGTTINTPSTADIGSLGESDLCDLTGFEPFQSGDQVVATIEVNEPYTPE